MGAAPDVFRLTINGLIDARKRGPQRYYQCTDRLQIWGKIGTIGMHARFLYCGAAGLPSQRIKLQTRNEEQTMNRFNMHGPWPADDRDPRPCSDVNHAERAGQSFRDASARYAGRDDGLPVGAAKRTADEPVRFHAARNHA